MSFRTPGDALVAARALYCLILRRDVKQKASYITKLFYPLENSVYLAIGKRVYQVALVINLLMLVPVQNGCSNARGCSSLEAVEVRRGYSRALARRRTDAEPNRASVSGMVQDAVAIQDQVVLGFKHRAGPGESLCRGNDSSPQPFNGI